MVVRKLLDEFWGQVKRRALNGGQNDCVGRHRTSESKIAELDYTVSRDQDVLRFHISVNDPVRVQVVKSVH